jgi:hypothetical protein
MAAFSGARRIGARPMTQLMTYFDNPFRSTPAAVRGARVSAD